MKTSNVQSSYKALIASLSESLKVAGFLRRANTFTFSYGNNVGIIEFQRSVKSSREAILFTVNVGVVLGDLLEGGLSFVRKDSILNAHLRQRIGALLPERTDKWWLLMWRACLAPCNGYWLASVSFGGLAPWPTKNLG